MQKPRMKTNFDKLEAAGLVAGADDSNAVKTRTQERITELKTVAKKIEKVEAALADLYVLSKPARLKRLTQVMSAVKDLHASKLPTGAKKHVGNCLNELTSLREGVYASNAQVDRQTLSLITARQAHTEITAMVAASEARLDKITAESNQSSDMEDAYRKDEKVIQKNAAKAEQLNGIKTKAYMIVRMPVVPSDSILSIEKLTRLGFSVDSIGGYAVLNEQMVIGISPKFLLGEHAGAVKGEKAGELIRAEADRLRKLLQKKTGANLQFVSDKPKSEGSGVWFWLMSDRDLNAFARAFPGQHVKISRWGFAFNRE